MTPTKEPADAGQAEAQKLTETAESRGYLGTKVDPLPNSAHSLQSGPDAPPVHEAVRNVDIADLANKEAKQS